MDSLSCLQTHFFPCISCQRYSWSPYSLCSSAVLYMPSSLHLLLTYVCCCWLGDNIFSGHNWNVNPCSTSVTSMCIIVIPLWCLPDCKTSQVVLHKMLRLTCLFILNQISISLWSFDPCYGCQSEQCFLPTRPGIHWCVMMDSDHK